MRNTFKKNLEKFRRENGSLLEEMEINQVQRLVDYLDVVKTPHKDAASVDKLRKDFKIFYAIGNMLIHSSLIDELIQAKNKVLGF